MGMRLCFAFAVVGVAVATSTPAHAGAFKPITNASSADKIYPLGAFDSKLIYSHVKGETADEIRITDGVSDVLLLSTGAGIPIRTNGGLGIVGGRFLFQQYGEHLWATGGTPATTIKIQATAAPSLDLRASFAVVTPTLAWFSKPKQVTNQNGFAIWKTDGTAVGTKLITELICRDGDSPGFVQLGNQTLISVTPNAYVPTNSGLWVSDGTTTTQLAPAASGRAQRCGAYAFFFNNAAPRGWWRTDGTLAGTVAVSAVTNPTGGYCVGSTFLIAENGVRLRATTGGPPVEIGDDGTKNAVTPAYAAQFTTAGGVAYFVARKTVPPATRTIYRTDGTAAGTTLLVETQDTGYDYQFVTLPNGRILTATPDTNLVVSDGTVAGTVKTSIALQVSPGLSIGAKTYFWGTDPDHGAEPWVTDGTVAGTTLLDDVHPGPASSLTNHPDQGGIYAADGQLFVIANDGVRGAQLMAARVAPSSVRDGGTGTGSPSDAGANDGGSDASTAPSAPRSENAENAVTQDSSASCACRVVRPLSSSGPPLALLPLAVVLLYRRRATRRRSNPQGLVGVPARTRASGRARPTEENAAPLGAKFRGSRTDSVAE